MRSGGNGFTYSGFMMGGGLMVSWAASTTGIAARIAATASAFQRMGQLLVNQQPRILSQQLVEAPLAVTLPAHAIAERPAAAARGEEAQVLEPRADRGLARVHAQQHGFPSKPPEEFEFRLQPRL